MKERIADWMQRVVERRSDLEFDDLHIDDVDPSFGPRSMWPSGASQCLQMALLLRNDLGLPFTVAAGMSLRSSPTPAGTDFDTLQEIVAVMDDSPPSLYLFEQGDEPWRSDSDFREVVGDYMPATNFKLRGFFREWFDDNDRAFRRSFWLAG